MNSRKSIKLLAFIIILVALGLTCVFSICGCQNQENSAKDEAANKNNAENLPDALKSGLPTLADFGHSTCIPCKEMLPLLEELKSEYKGKANILIIDVYDEQELAYKYEIQLIPTQIFFNNKGEEVFRHEGFMDKDSIKKKMKEIGVE